MWVTLHDTIPIPHPLCLQDRHMIQVKQTMRQNLVYKTGVWYTLVTLRDKIPHTPPTCVQDRRAIQVSYPTWHNPQYRIHPVYKIGIWYKWDTLHDTIYHTPPTFVQDRYMIKVSQWYKLPYLTLFPIPHPPCVQDRHMIQGSFPTWHYHQHPTHLVHEIYAGWSHGSHLVQDSPLL